MSIKFEKKVDENIGSPAYSKPILITIGIFIINTIVILYL